MQNLFSSKELILLGSAYEFLVLSLMNLYLSLLVSIAGQFLLLIQSNDHKAQGKKNTKSTSTLVRAQPRSLSDWKLPI